MLQEVGVASVDELFEPIPQAVRFESELKVERSMAEQELISLMRSLSAANASGTGTVSFLGAGCNPHFVPTHVDALIQRQEFLTAYTPYQAEVGQGTLQAIFEFQSLVCLLTGMEVCNASVYDGASSVAEAVLMARRLLRRGGKVLVSGAVHPTYVEVARTYTRYLDIEFETLPVDGDGRTLLERVDESAIAVVLQQPNFFGVMEDLRQAAAKLGEAAAKFVVVTSEPLAFGLAVAPGAAGADLVVGDLQSFGNGMNYGGPMLGFLACRDRDKRNLPGRLAGETVDEDGKRGYVLTLSTREQHIRRARATSNICSNEALCALAACIHMATLGKGGVSELAAHNLAKASYARQALQAAGFDTVFGGPHFNEFVVRVGMDAGAACRACGKRGVVPGVPLGLFDLQRREQLLVCVTEVHSRQQIDRMVEVLQEVAR